MKTLATTIAALGMAILAACGGGAAPAPGGTLAVTNDVGGGQAFLDDVLFEDVATHAVLFQRGVFVVPGRTQVIEGLTPGPYLVVGHYHDGRSDPMGSTPGYPVTIDVGVDAEVTFRHP